MALFPIAPPSNFTSTYSVHLPHAPDRVFAVLGAGSNLETVARLSTAVQSAELGETELVPLPDCGVAQSRGNQLLEPVKEGEGKVAKRTVLRMHEMFPLAFGL